MSPEEIINIPALKIKRAGVFSGGGANGYWEWRYANELRENGITLDLCAGTSTGAIMAFLYSKGKAALPAIEPMLAEAYNTDARSIFKPGIAKIKNGKIDINWFKLITKLPSYKKITSLMDNTPLYEKLLLIDKEFPGGSPCFVNVFSLKTGRKVSLSIYEDFDTPEERCKAIAASATIPVIFPPYNSLRGISAQWGFLVDGGVTDGLPTDFVWEKIDRKDPWEILVFQINKNELMETEDLDNVVKVLGRTASSMMLEILNGDKAGTQLRSEIATAVWPVIEALENMNLIGLAQQLRAVVPFKAVPLETILYPGTTGVFEFTPQSMKIQDDYARSGVASYLESRKMV